MRSGEVAAHAGVNVQTLRYYERRGLLEEPQRSSAGYRAYPADAVEVVRFVKRAQELGFTLDDVAELLDLADGGPESCESVRDVAQVRLAQIEAKIAALMLMKDSLVELVATCELPRADRRCALLRTLHHDR